MKGALHLWFTIYKYLEPISAFIIQVKDLCIHIVKTTSSNSYHSIFICEMLIHAKSMEPILWCPISKQFIYWSKTSISKVAVVVDSVVGRVTIEVCSGHGSQVVLGRGSSARVFALAECSQLLALDGHMLLANCTIRQLA